MRSVDEKALAELRELHNRVAMLEADLAVARAQFGRAVRAALIAAGASPSDEVDERTGAITERKA